MQPALSPKIAMTPEQILGKAMDYRARCATIDEKISLMDACNDVDYINTLKGTKIAFLMVARAMEAVLGIPLDPDEMA